MAWVRVVDSPYPRSAQQENLFANGPVLALCAVVLAGFLALVLTFGIINYDFFPFPSDDAISLGLLGFTFIVLLDLIAICWCWWTGFRNHSLGEALVKTVLLVPAGLLVASVVGVLPWSFHWLLTHYPWIETLLKVCYWGFLVFWIVQGRRARRRKQERSLDRPS